MTQLAAPMSPLIRRLTALYFVILAGLAIGGLWQWPLWIGAGVIAAVSVYVWFCWTPVAYDLTDGTLTVMFRAGTKVFPGVTAIGPVTDELRRWLHMKVCGNGGLFCMSGLYCHRHHGWFRAYVTDPRPIAVLVVVTARGKVLISPHDPSAFADHHAGGGSRGA